MCTYIVAFIFYNLNKNFNSDEEIQIIYRLEKT